MSLCNSAEVEFISHNPGFKTNIDKSLAIRFGSIFKGNCQVGFDCEM